MIAFEDPASTLGYMLPLIYLVKQGFHLEKKTKPNSAVTEDELGYVFSAEDQNTIQWMLRGRVTARTIDNRNFMDIPEKTRELLTILVKTEVLPNRWSSPNPI
jgi:phosphonate transport system substrate-binding protein